MSHSRIEDYALIGDLHTAALISRTGSLDWACFPRFDSASAFAELLGDETHGSWQLGPLSHSSAPAPATHRRYVGDSLALESTWVTTDGTLQITDAMPPAEHDAHIPHVVRIVKAVSGRVTVRSCLRPRFDYGLVRPRVSKEAGERWLLVAGPDALWLDTSVPTHVRDGALYSDLTLSEGDTVTFTLTYRNSHQGPPPVIAPEAALAMTLAYWEGWVSRCTYQGEYREAVIRSLITLKALTYAPTGGIVAAPTTSLPEEIGGERNWDYRFCWLRDAAITLSSLLRTGYRDEARHWAAWLLRAVAGDPSTLQIMYGITGKRRLPESELPHLPGYMGSRPVRIGNGAASQLQLDVYGEVIETLTRARQAGLGVDETAADLQVALVEWLEQHWDEPDEGVWEVRGPRRHFVHSKVMAWVAVDRTIKLIESGEAAGPLERWRELRDTIHQDVCERGYDQQRNTFTQSYGSRELDASLLLIPQMGFLPPDDGRVVGTIEAIQRELSTQDGLILRYPTTGETAGVDGLTGDEGAFLACSFWLADDLAMIGRTEKARQLFERLLTLRNDVGLLAEEWDPRRRRQVGNFPQAFSHVALVDSAVALDRASATAQTAASPTLTLRELGQPDSTAGPAAGVYDMGPPPEKAAAHLAAPARTADGETQ
ncbi:MULTISPECIES: glycoside hydrolase family 15 protein [Streptomyces]|uniref:Trehalase n=2 Tax=Streptomyces TaxID=1883 RepID=A0A3R7EMH6_9ACTN|nr:glycoside hydrolase family 15 protein [Streptomyces xinghaiensis]RKM92526.1 glycoside hydrolase family 15 protein [Streptomyces xinghaiensis]RNC70493.1 glycoside hydrolase family 15 protein [Streptomyces xinghaiensis]